MPHYRNHGIAFTYPAEWTLSEAHSEELTDITVADEGTAFWSLQLMWSRPPIEDVLEEIEQIYRDEYTETDIDANIVPLARRQAEAREISFVAMELLNTAFIRSFRTGRFTVLLTCQSTDHDLERVQPLFAGISQSLDVDLDGDVLIG